MEFYDKYIEKENEYYRTLQVTSPENGKLHPPVLEEAIDWLCRSSRRILDFGCGSGGLSFPCAFRGVEEVIGIDPAVDAIRYASACATTLPQCRFLLGSVDQLRKLPDDSFDGVLFSNVLDNMRPEDAISALAEAHRLLRPNGKAFVKLNPYLTMEQISQWKIQSIGDDLLDDGLLLWNREDGQWKSLLENYFIEVEQRDVYFEEQDVHNRLFLCRNLKSI